MTSPLCEQVIGILRDRGQTLATAESLTGGGIGAALTAVPGASAVYVGGVISYVDRVKREVLKVPASDLREFGAVSLPVAQAMAAGVRDLTGADFALSVTGLAGPAGDAFGNPVGTVFIGLAAPGAVAVREYHLEGTRQEIRCQTMEMALTMLLQAITT